jgi:chromosome segregation ATPase
MLQLKTIGDKCKGEIAKKTEEHKQVSEALNQRSLDLNKVTASLETHVNLANDFKRKHVEQTHLINEREQQLQEAKLHKQTTDEKLANKNKELKRRTMELQSAQKKILTIEREREDIRKKKEEADSFRDWMKEEMKRFLKSLEAQKRDTESDEKLIRKLQVLDLNFCYF